MGDRSCAADAGAVALADDNIYADTAAVNVIINSSTSAADAVADDDTDAANGSTSDNRC